MGIGEVGDLFGAALRPPRLRGSRNPKAALEDRLRNDRQRESRKVDRLPQYARLKADPGAYEKYKIAGLQRAKRSQARTYSDPIRLAQLKERGRQRRLNDPKLIARRAAKIAIKAAKLKAVEDRRTLRAEKRASAAQLLIDKRIARTVESRSKKIALTKRKIEAARLRRAANPDLYRARGRAHYQRNAPAVCKARQERRRTDPQFALYCRLQRSMRKHLRLNTQRLTKMQEVLGFSVAQLRKHLQKQSNNTTLRARCDGCAAEELR